LEANGREIIKGNNMEPIIFLIIWSCFCLIILFGFFFDGKKALLIFHKSTDNIILYKNNNLTGYSRGVGIWATSIIDIIVTDSELWITGSILTAGILNKFDLIHKISINNVQSIKIKNKRVQINFVSVFNKQKSIVLIINDNLTEFLKCFPEQIIVTPNSSSFE
jgi:hypothetical protein